MSGRSFVIWAEMIDKKYEIGTTDSRYRPPFGVEVIAIVDEIDLYMMTRYIEKQLSFGKSPEQIREECEAE